MAKTVPTTGFIMMLDNSYSMSQVIEQVRVDANAFIGDAWPNDQFGVIKFNDTASWLYPTGKNPEIVTVSEKLTEIHAAEKVIDLLRCEGSLTNIGDAIRLSYDLYKQATTDIKAFVLLSDGASNTGSDPVKELDGEPPIYIAGLGSVTQQYFTPMIKKNPASQYYPINDKTEMMQIFNDIRNNDPNVIMLANQWNYYQHAGYQIVPATVCSDSGKVQFSVVWPNQKYKYTSGQPNGCNINVQLIDPKGHHRRDEPTIVGNGYCTFDLEDAPNGAWDVLVKYDLSAPIYGTVGAFQLDTKINLNLAVPNVISAGQPIPLDIELNRNSNPLEHMRVQATVKRPAISIENALQKYQSQLKNIRLEENGINPGIPEEIERLRILHRQLLPQEDILPKSSSLHTLAYSSNKGMYENTFTETLIPGAYTLEVKATGVDPKTGQPLTWFKNQSVIVK